MQTRNEKRLMVAAQILSAVLPETLSSEAEKQIRYSLCLADMLIEANDQFSKSRIVEDDKG